MYINNLAKEILKNVPDGISKVKFAKILYFVHKGLVLNKQTNVTNLKFIRMPLGPVPVGFKDLYQDREISVEKTPSSLSYNMQIYKVLHSISYFEKPQQEIIAKLVKKFMIISTSELIEISHKEPSWLNHINGEEYFITDEDLKIDLPIQSSTKIINTEIDEQRIQARLVEGMIDDIVKESTALEYPDKD